MRISQTRAAGEHDLAGPTRADRAELVEHLAQAFHPKLGVAGPEPELSSFDDDAMEAGRAGEVKRQESNLATAKTSTLPIDKDITRGSPRDREHHGARWY
jgi:hypothetical protein